MTYFNAESIIFLPFNESIEQSCTFVNTGGATYFALETVEEILKAEEENGTPVNVSMDCLCGETLGKSLPFMARGGYWIVISTLAGITTEIQLRPLLTKGLHLVGSMLRNRKPEFKAYQEQIVKNASALADQLVKEGFKLVSGGTDNHLMLVDLTTYGLTGKAVEKLLDSVHITCNKNTIPNDPKSPFVTSGIRLGTPAITSRGMNEADMDKIAEAIALVIKKQEAGVAEARAIVQELTDKYPLV